VVGAGSVGLLTGAVARLHGVDVDIAVRHDRQREAAERLGLRRELTGRYDVVFDAAGTGSSLATAIDVARSGSIVVVPGIYWGDVTMPGLALMLKEVTLRPALYWGQHDGRRETEIAAEVLGRMPDLPDVLVTHRFPLARAADAFATAADRAAGAIKVVIEP
jgi:threonine dehydrogenase-like Zn-dependent dehydrogenase